jgi:lactate dehydrogenase-like 2-hydroxyacid dehydrogenase
MTSRPEIVLLRATTPYLLDRCERHFQVHRWWELETQPAATAIASRAQVLVTDGILGASAEIIDQFPELRLIASFGVGYEAVDVRHAARRGVVVTNTPDVLTDDVADLGLALTLALVREILSADRYVRAGRWFASPYGLTRRLGGMTVGIVGLGRIGKALATRLRACGATVVYHGRTRQTDQPYRYYADLLDMARAVNVLVAVVPGTAQTAGLVSRAVLEALGPHGYFVNIARGSIVDEAALVELLAARKLAGAGLDVFAHEPQVPAALLALDNVVLQPHQGSATHETRQAMADLVVANVQAHFAGQDLLTPVPA